MMKKNKNQNGAISLFVLFSMLFFLAFILGAFSLVNRRNTEQIQTLKETKELYKSGESGKDAYDSMVSTSNTVVPISTKEQLIKVMEIKNANNGTANYVINGKMYTYTKDANYMLQNNIILDLKDEIDGKNNITIYDYMLYSSTYDIDTNGYDIYYAQKDGSIWKCVCYQNMGTSSNQKLFSNTNGNTYYYGKSYSPERYSILSVGLNKYRQKWAGIDCFEFMLMYNSDNKKFDTDSVYNRWRQTNNPGDESKTYGSTIATGYNIKFYNDENNTNVSYYSGRNGINPSDTYWGGLMQSGTLYYYLTGGMQSELSSYYQNGEYYQEEKLYYYYPVGKTTFDTNDGYYGINVAPNTYASECLLFVRVK